MRKINLVPKLVAEKDSNNRVKGTFIPEVQSINGFIESHPEYKKRNFFGF